MNWDIVIGLEVHVQLSTKTKIFSGASTEYGAPSNSQASIIDLALPGTLPTLNQEVVNKAIMFGVAINGTISKNSQFDRKNYFYPDLPKGYQISQLDNPIVSHGSIAIEINNKSINIPILRAHLEEDAGKSDHLNFSPYTGVDLNRAGTPLLEIVTEPVLTSAKESLAYLKALHKLVRYIEISDGNMQEGSFRCDINISLKPQGSKTLGTRAEIKNLNSFKFIEKAINHEYKRQSSILESGEKVKQETRLYDPNKDKTFSMRSKEDAHDYRYFPDPDLIPICITPQYITDIKNALPELPDQINQRFIQQYKLSYDAVQILTSTKDLALYFEETVRYSKSTKITANWIISELIGYLNKHSLSIKKSPISPKSLGLLISRIHDNTITNKIAKEVFEEIIISNSSADDIIEKKGLKQIDSMSEIQEIIETLIRDNPKQFEQLAAGKTKLFGFFVGQVMKLTQGKANPKQINDILKSKLN
jgi:aspartyl-tRNA(Asn)/glutamyl-tRNA(Gln) amidotransferase subunit B